MTTVNVTVKVIDQKGLPVNKAVVTAKLSTLEVQAGLGYVVTEKVSGVTDVTGNLILPLWPNQLGTTESHYNITIKNPDTGKIEQLIATIPNNDCYLHAVANLPAYPGKSDGQLAIDEAIAAVAPAQAAKISAEAAAATATAQALIATSAANTIGIAVTDSQAYALAASVSAANAAASAVAAGVSEGIVSTKEGIVSTKAATVNTQALQVGADSAQVATDLLTITGLASTVLTNKAIVDTKTAQVTADAATVASDKTYVTGKATEVSNNTTLVSNVKTSVDASLLVVNAAEANVVSLSNTVAANTVTSTTKASEASASEIAAAASAVSAASNAAITSSFNITIGTVSEGPASATLTGVAPARVLNLVLPKGEDGADGTGSLNSVSGTAPVNVTAGTDPVVSMAQATNLVDGYLSSADWNTFNSKKAGSYAPTWSEVTSKPSFAAVATSGDYDDLSNKPTVTFPTSGTLISTAPSTAGNVLTSDGTNWVSSAPSGGSGAALSIPTSTGDVVPSGSLLAIDDAGLPMSVNGITTAVIQATTSIDAICAVGLNNGNTAIFWRSSSSARINLMIVDKIGATVVAPMAAGTATDFNSRISACVLTNNNIVIAYTKFQNTYFKIFSDDGLLVTSETSIAPASKFIRICALTGGGWAGVYENHPSDTLVNITVRDSSGVSLFETLEASSEGVNYLDIGSTPSGGFFIIIGSANMFVSLWDSSAAFIVSGSNGLNRVGGSAVANNGILYVCGGEYLSISSSSASYKSLPKYRKLDATSNADWNTGVEEYLNPRYSSAYSILTMAHSNSSMCVRGDSAIMAFHMPMMNGSAPILSKIHDAGCDSETAFEEPVNGMYVNSCFLIPKGQNGLNIVWVAKNKNIKFANIKSGKVIGISLGQVGANTLYKTSGVATDLTNSNILNVGDRQVNITRQGKKVFI